jgi:hypothetical protein
MHAIFLSYRRDDAHGWAALLFRDLTERFGKDVLFMDIEGGIPRGADFEKTLSAALASCHALLAIVGPRWLELKRDQQRRIDRDDDWVRTEIGTALARDDVVVLPVLVGNAGILQEHDLPANLKPLSKRQASQLRPEHWDDELPRLVADLACQLPMLAELARRRAVEGAARGFRRLETLITNGADDAIIIQSRASIATVHAQIERIEAFKSIHDALHMIEHDCLRPLQASRTRHVVFFRLNLVKAARRVRASIEASRMSASLKADLEDNLRRAEVAFQSLVDEPGDEQLEQVLNVLSELIGGIPTQLDAAIADASANMNLDQLIEHMQKIANVLEPVGLKDVNAPEVAARTPLQRSVTALRTLRDELKLRVEEHSHLQRLDSELRMLGAAAIPTKSLTQRWSRAKSLRGRLTPPFTGELTEAMPILDALALEVDKALAGGADAAEHLAEYFRAVGSVFREIDGTLRELCIELVEVGAPLKTILELLGQAA